MKAYIFYKDLNWKISSRAKDVNGWEVIYTPVDIVSYSDVFSLKKAIINALINSEQVVDLGDFPGNQDDYKTYVSHMMSSFKEKSFDELQKTHQEFIIEYHPVSQILKVVPLVWGKGGSAPNANEVEEFDVRSLQEESLDQLINYLDRVKGNVP